MRTILRLAIGGGLILALAGIGAASDDRSEPAAAVGAHFSGTVRPFLETYCLGCHGKDRPKGDLDLSAFTTADSVARDLPRWDLVLEQLEAGTMPPAKAKSRPADEARRAVIAWIGEVRRLDAARHAG